MRQLSELMTLEGRVALVAGGAGHIGMAACETLAELGASVACLDLEAGRAKHVADTISSGLGSAIALGVDLNDEAAVRAVPGTVVDRFGRLDVVVHTAAFVNQGNTEGYAAPFEKQTGGPWRQALEVNLTSAFFLVQSAAPALRESGHGSVILFGSIYGALGPDLRLYEGTEMGNAAGYAASKGGTIQLARWLATVLAPEIRVNAISPGGVQRGQPESFVRHYEERTPLRRMCSEEDIKGAVAYLASDMSAYVTGHNLFVDGGWTAW